MDWRGRFTVALALVAVVVAFGVTTLTGAAPVPEPERLGTYGQFKVADGAPLALGPAIVDVTYRDVGNDNNPANDEMYVLFNKYLDGASVQAADFAFNVTPGGLATGTLVATWVGGEPDKVILTGFTAEPTATDSVALSARGVVLDGFVTGNPNEDVSWVHIKRGPIIQNVFFDAGYGTETVVDDVLTVWFTHELSAATVSAANAKLDFDMAEFGTSTGINPVTTYVPGNTFLTISFDSPATTAEDFHFGRVKPGVSKLRMNAAGVLQGNRAGSGDPTNEPNQSTRWVRVREAGPALIAAGLDDRGDGDSSNDVLTLVFNRDIPSGVLLTGADLNLSTAGVAFNPSVSSLDGDHVVTFQDMTDANIVLGVSTVTPSVAFTDHQTNGAVPVTVAIQPSPIMLLARFNDAGDAVASTDQLEVIFDTGVAGSFADTTDFNYFGFVSDGLIITDTLDNDSLLVFTGFTGTNTWRPGDRIQIRSGATLPGVRDGLPFGPPSYAGRPLHPVRDASAPRTLLYQPNLTWTRDTAAPAPDDTAFVALNELGTDDSGYYLFYARKNNPVDLLYAQSHFNNAVFVTNPSPGPDVPFAGPINLDRNVITSYVITPVTGTYTDGQPMDLLDVVRFGVLGADLEGNVSFFTPSNLFFGGLVVGPVPCPQDYIAGEDDNIIHVWSDGVDRFIGSDPNSVLASNVDSVRVYGEPGPATGPLLGSAPVASNGSWGPINLGPYTGDFVYPVSVDDFGSVSAGCAGIINDQAPPELVSAIDPLQYPFAPEYCYSGGDTLHILANFGEVPVGGDGGSFPSANDLLRVSADLTGFVTNAGADDVLFFSLGANQVDDDNDWLDVAVDIVANPTFTGNGRRDYPEPYIDENRNGQWDAGETFVDVIGPDYRDNLYDFGDYNLDSNDEDEHGWYMTQYYLAPANLVADPEGMTNFAVLEDVPAPITALNNVVLSQATLNGITETASTLLDLSANVLLYDLQLEAVFPDAFIANEDSQAPTVSEISFLERQLSWINPSGNAAGPAPVPANIIEPGDHVYKLAAGDAAPFFNLADSTLSDDDVIFVALQIDPTPNTADNADFEWLNFDPAGDANGDGAPGILDYDDDNDAGNLLINGIDDDGINGIDDEGEGRDLSDPQIMNALQADATADAASLVPDGTHRLNDYIDNDGDAFFRFNPISSGWVWFNIDESDTNGVDDNGVSGVDDPGEVENYTLANAIADDDEDGIADGCAVGINVNPGQYLPDPTYQGRIYVKGFVNGDLIAKYSGTPATNAPADFGTYADDLTANDGVPGKRDRLSMVNAGADMFGGASFAYGAQNVISRSTQVNPAGGGAPWVPVSKGAGVFAFDYRAQNGRNLNMKVIKSLYGLNDGDEYRLRAVAYDACYQGNANWAVPLRFAVDSEPPEVTIPAPPFDDVVDIDPIADGIQICDVQVTDWDGLGGPDPKVYTLEADVITGLVDDIAQVEFQVWNPGTLAWDVLGTDSSFPYTLEWSYPNAPLGNNPPALQDTVYFRTIATDLFGNIEAQALCDSLYTDDTLTEPCFELQAIIVDCTPPWSCLCQIGTDYNPMDGAFVPVESAVDISACFSDNDGDPTTNDVVRIEFQYRAVGATTWLNLPSLTGVPVDTTGDGIPDVLEDVTGIRHPIIQPDPNVDSLVATVTWDTRGFPMGSYDLRAVAFDIEGNDNANMTCTATATLDNIGLRAYIQPCFDVQASNVDSLFAHVYIHDMWVSKVEFQYYADVDGDGLPNDGSDWVSIGIQGDDERKGDIVLRAGRSHNNELMDASGPISLQTGSKLRYLDIDGDGYNPVDPIVSDQNFNLIFDSGDFYRAAFAAGYSEAELLAMFTDDPTLRLATWEADEYWMDTDKDGIATEMDWLLKHNGLNAQPDTQFDFWTSTWDVTGLNGCFLVRAVATDQLGNVDDDGDGDGVPDHDDVIWFEQCCVDSDAPLFCVTQYIPADGPPAVDIPAGPSCPWVAPQDFLTMIATPYPGTEYDDVDSVQFYFFRNGIDTEWQYFGTDFVEVDGWSMVFAYGDSAFVTDTETNFRAIAYDDEGNVNMDPDFCKACLVLAENQGPETDIVMIVTAEGDTLDANTVLRGNLDPYCLLPTQLYMLVTAEDNQTIDRVEIWYRKVAGITPSDTTSWALYPGLVDDTYPYEFNWDISALTDGVYEFFPRGFDVGGNYTPVFGNPFRFSLSRRTAMVVAAEKGGVPKTSLTPGEEVVIKAELDDPADNVGVAVEFFYAERIEGEVLSVSATYPYAANADYPIWSGGAMGMHGSETVYVNGVPATWYGAVDFAALGAPTKMDYTILGTNTLHFGAAMAVTDTVTIDYNVTDCIQIDTGDDESPYSVAWDADSFNGLVPFPTNPNTTHYDLMASASRTFFGFDGDGCGEGCVSEGFALPLMDTEAPDFVVWGLDYRNENLTDNLLCSTCNEDWPMIQGVGSCKSRLAGIEHQFFVETDDDVVSVTMTVDGGTPIDFVHYTAEDDSVVTIPLTFYMDLIAADELNEWEYQAINPDSVENVTIDIPGISVYNTAMIDNGDGTFTYYATLPLGAAYDYTVHVDYVGDDQWDDTFGLVIPADMWFFSTEDPASVFALNDLQQVVVTVTDEAGNVSTNLMSGRMGGGALGQIWVTWDTTPPVVTELFFTTPLLAPGDDFQIMALVRDSAPANADIVGNVWAVSYQASMDDNENRWRELYWTEQIDNLFDYWEHSDELPDWMNPSNDGIDNDLDGLTDEADECTYTYKIRAVVYDDCYFNVDFSYGHPRAQATPVFAELTVDACVPQACLTTPGDGDLFAIGDMVDLVATSTDTDLDYVQFEYSLDSGFSWNTIDCTPLNDDDDPWVSEPNGSGEWVCSWDTSFLAQFLSGDFYVSLRAKAVDMVGNKQSDDPELDCNVNIVMNDNTGPTAFIARFYAPCFPTDINVGGNFKRPYDPTLALSGDVTIWGQGYGWNGWDIASVVMEISSDSQNWTVLGVLDEFIDQGGTASTWSFDVDFDLYAEGTWYLRVYGIDADGNVQGDTDDDGYPNQLPVVPVLVDHVAPDFKLIQVGVEGYGDNTLVAGDLIRANLLDAETGICPELSEGIIWAAAAVDPAGEVEVVDTMWLEWLDDVTDNENPTWHSLQGAFGDFTFRDAAGAPAETNPDGTWWLWIDSVQALADAMQAQVPGELPAKEYKFRVQSMDYACNVNDWSEGISLRLDHFVPMLMYIYAGSTEFEAGAGAEGNTVHVAGGDTVPLAARVNDFFLERFYDSGGLGMHTIRHESSGLFAVQFSYRTGDNPWTIIGLGVLDDNGTPDDDLDDLWRLDWTTPDNLPGGTDNLYDIRVIVRDNAGNSNCPSGEWATDLIEVQDITPPEDTKLIAVGGRECGTYPYTDIRGVIDTDSYSAYGIDDNVLAQDLTGATALGVVARTVELFAATPQGDFSMGGGQVFFEGRRVDPSKPNATGPWMLIGEGECIEHCVMGYEVLEEAAGVTMTAGQHLGPIWMVEWNTLAQAPDGSFIWYDDTQDGNSVQIRVWSVDNYGNIETMTDDAIYHLIVDNTKPTMVVSAQDPETGTVVTEVERNAPDGVLVVATGGGSTLVNDDLIVSYYWKLATDLNEVDSWVMLDPVDGIPPTNDSPDENRPYAFHWNTNEYRDPEGMPLIPNEDYHLAVEVQDLVCNTLSVVEQFDAGGYGDLKFVDTIAPVATIVELKRDYDEVVCQVDENLYIKDPLNERINGVDWMRARILDGATDTQDVQFYYRAAGTSAWTLADADVDMKDLDDIQSWKLYNWSTAPLAEGAWEMAAIATDDAGNADANPPVMPFIIDRSGPVFAGVNPTDGQIIVPENLGEEVCDPDMRVADLIAFNNDGDVAYKNSWENCVGWQWKWSVDEDVDENWNSFGAMTLFDGFTSRWSTTVDLLDEFGQIARLVDWRVVATDVAGNTTWNGIATRTVVDNVDPDLEITHFNVDGDEDTTIDPIDNGQITDVSAGEQIWIYATVDDDEPNLPDDLDTDVEEVQFFVRSGLVGTKPGLQESEGGGAWRLIGTAGYDEQLGLWGVKWNTTGLAEGDYEIMARATDEAANCGNSHSNVIVSVENIAVPLAQVAGFNPHLKSVITKNTLDRVYGLTFGEKDASTVFFQYKLSSAGDTDWTTIGTATYTGETLIRQPGSENIYPNQWLIPQDLWYARLQSSDLDADVTYDLRAVATDALPAKPGDGGLALKSRIPGQGAIEPLDGDPNIFSGLYDLANTPILKVRVEQDAFGRTMLVPADELGYLDDISTRFTGRDVGTGRVIVETGNPLLAPFVVAVVEDATGAVAEAIVPMEPMVDDQTIWVGDILADGFDSIYSQIDPTQGGVMTIYASAHLKRASASDPAPLTEMIYTDVRSYKLSVNKGTNGKVGVDGNGALAEDGYPVDDFVVNVPAGAIENGQLGLVLNRTDMPKTQAWQEEWIETVGPFAYETILYNSNWNADHREFIVGKTATVWVRYDEADLVREDGSLIPESSLSVRVWDALSSTSDEDGWEFENITKVMVDTLDNVIRFETSDISDEVFAVVSEAKSPWTVDFAPYWSGYTDQDPIIRGTIRLGTEDLDSDGITLYIDGDLVYSSDNDWFKYGGSEFDWEWLGVNPSTSDAIGWTYLHTCANEDALKDGPHTVRIEIAQDELSQPLSSPEWTFYVDRKAPYIEFHGGFVGNPRLGFAAGYVNLVEDVVTVRMFDGGSGLLFQEDRIDDVSLYDSDDECAWDDAHQLCERYGDYLWNEFGWDFCDDNELLFGDDGFKFDVWVVNDAGGSDHGSPDDLETRTLIYTGTADAVAPYLTPQLSEYTPGDTLTVPLAVLTGGELIEDGSVLEITLYSHKLLVWPLDWGVDELLPDEVLAMFSDAGISLNFGWDADQEVPVYYAYITGPMDNVGNAGSRFVEQRFIVDTSAPQVLPSSPGVSCDGETVAPVEQTDRYQFTASFLDNGVGVDPASVSVRVLGPSGTPNVQNLDVTANGVSFQVSNEGNLLEVGTYTVTITGKDLVGNEFAAVCAFTVGTNVIEVRAAKMIPNPFNPLVGDATISFELTKPADVEVTVYDWAGDYVATIYQGSKGVGPVHIEWGGQTEDGRALGNGVYLVRIVVDDGFRQEPRVLKVAIWNER